MEKKSYLCVMIKNSRYDYKLAISLLVSIAMACLVGCDKPSDKLDTAYRMINERPDSAYSVLQDIDYDDLTADSLKAKYINQGMGKYPCGAFAHHRHFVG